MLLDKATIESFITLEYYYQQGDVWRIGVSWSYNEWDPMHDVFTAIFGPSEGARQFESFDEIGVHVAEVGLDGQTLERWLGQYGSVIEEGDAFSFDRVCQEMRNESERRHRERIRYSTRRESSSHLSGQTVLPIASRSPAEEREVKA